MNPALEACLEFVGINPSGEQERQLGLLAAWLIAEAIPAGAIGPSEGPIINERHVADSILFAGGWNSPPARCWDLGSGAGLPGLVLSILWPGSHVTLFDRSIRRIDLIRRGARIVEVEIEAALGEIATLEGPVEAIVSRAAMPAGSLLPHLRRILGPGGIAVVSGTGSGVVGYEEMAVPPGILDHSPRLLMMRA